MSRILVGSVPAAGHVDPLVPLVRALVARGHEVKRIAGARFRAKVEAAGATFMPMRHARDDDDARIDKEFPERTRVSGIAQLKFDRVGHCRAADVTGHTAGLFPGEPRAPLESATIHAW